MANHNHSRGHISVTPETHRKLQAYGQRKGISMGQLVEQIIHQALEKAPRR